MASASVIHFVVVTNCLVIFIVLINCLVIIIVLIPSYMDVSIHLVIEHVNDHYYCYGFIIIAKCYHTMVVIMSGCHTFLIVVVVIFIQLFLISILIVIVIINDVINDVIVVIVIDAMVIKSDAKYPYQQHQQLT